MNSLQSSALNIFERTESTQNRGEAREVLESRNFLSFLEEKRLQKIQEKRQDERVLEERFVEKRVQGRTREETITRSSQANEKTPKIEKTEEIRSTTTEEIKKEKSIRVDGKEIGKEKRIEEGIEEDQKWNSKTLRELSQKDQEAVDNKKEMSSEETKETKAFESWIFSQWKSLMSEEADGTVSEKNMARLIELFQKFKSFFESRKQGESVFQKENIQKLVQEFLSNSLSKKQSLALEGKQGEEKVLIDFLDKFLNRWSSKQSEGSSIGSLASLKDQGDLKLLFHFLEKIKEEMSGMNSNSRNAKMGSRGKDRLGIADDKQITKRTVLEGKQSESNSVSFDLGQETSSGTLESMRIGVLSERGSFENTSLFSREFSDLLFRLPRGFSFENAQKLFQQVVQKASFLRNANQNEMHIQLEPKAMGRLWIQVVMEEGVVTGRFWVENSAVKQLLEENMSLLKMNLEKQGLQVDDLDIALSSDSQRDFLFEQQKKLQNDIASLRNRNLRGLGNSEEMEGMQGMDESFFSNHYVLPSWMAQQLNVLI